MNRSYRTVWNHALGTWVAISELGRRRGRNGVRTGVAVALLAGAVMGAQAQLFWDRNGDNFGAGPQLDGVWDSTSGNWNVDSLGFGAIVSWQPNNIAVFAAGNNSVPAYHVQVDPGGITGVAGIWFLNTSPVSMDGGPIALAAPGRIVMAPNTPNAVTYSIGSALTGVDLQVLGSGGPQVSTLRLSNTLNLSNVLFVESKAVLELAGTSNTSTSTIWVDDARLNAYGVLATPGMRVQNGGIASIAGLDAAAEIGVIEVFNGSLSVSDGARLTADTITVDGSSSQLFVINPGSVIDAQGPVKAIGGALLALGNEGVLRAPSVALGSDSDTAGGALLMAFGGVLETGGISVGDTLRLPGTVAVAQLTNAEIRATRSNPEFFARFQDGELQLVAGVTAINSNGFDIGTASGFAGDGGLAKIGEGTVTLGGTSAYAGPTHIQQGTLIAGNANSLSPQSWHYIAPGATLDLRGHGQTVSGIRNGGMVSLVGSAPGTTLTVRGDYAGLAGSTLRLGTALGDSTSLSDRLVIDGGTVSGQSRVAIVNLGGLGAQTTGNGIEVIAAINGGTTTAQTTKDGFVLAGGHVDAGAYEYTLHPADAGKGESWYLRSAVPAAPAQPPTGGPTPTAAPGPAAPTATASLPTYRREVPLFAALPSQLQQAGQQMLGDLHKRIGDDQAGDPGSRRAWGRVIAGDSDTRQTGTVNPASDGRYAGFQAGTDLWADGDWRLGVYAGQLDSDPKVSGIASGTWGPVGHNDLRSQYFAGYGTWRNASGWYTDLVVQGGRHRISLEPHSTLHWNTKASSLAASVEAGKSMVMGDGGWILEPQLQLVRQRANVDDTVISGARVQTDGGEGWLARAGLRAKAEFSTAAGSLQPYGRVNVYRVSGNDTRARFIGPAASTDILTSVESTLAEAATGFTLAMTPALSLYGEVGKVFDVGGSERQESTLRGTLGLKARW